MCMAIFMASRNREEFKQKKERNRRLVTLNIKGETNVF